MSQLVSAFWYCIATHLWLAEGWGGHPVLHLNWWPLAPEIWGVWCWDTQCLWGSQISFYKSCVELILLTTGFGLITWLVFFHIFIHRPSLGLYYLDKGKKWLCCILKYGNQAAVILKQFPGGEKRPLRKQAFVISNQNTRNSLWFHSKNDLTISLDQFSFWDMLRGNSISSASCY